MKPIYRILLAIVVLMSFKPSKPQDNNRIMPALEVRSHNHAAFQAIKGKYDTLITLFAGLFITHDKIAGSDDPEHKWGVIDSLGNIVIPFMCDGIAKASGDTGIASIYSSNKSMETGVPRYWYEGKYFYFTKNGRTDKKEHPFFFLVEHLADEHQSKFVIRMGPKFYLPRMRW